MSFPYPTDPLDHSETPRQAFEDIKDIVYKFKEFNTIYDPFYCNGQSGKILSEIFVPPYSVINECIDFYSRLNHPDDSIIVTNPPYSEDHIERFFKWVIDTKDRPSFILVPNYVYRKNWFNSKNFIYYCPDKRYVFMTPKNLSTDPFRNDKNKYFNRKTSPFFCFWFIYIPDTFLTNDKFMKDLVNIDPTRIKTSIKDLPFHVRDTFDPVYKAQRNKLKRKRKSKK